MCCGSCMQSLIPHACIHSFIPSLIRNVPTQLDRFVHYKFKCPLCGQPCVLEIPVIKLTYTIETPPCPVEPHSVRHAVEHHLWSQSPDRGIKNRLDGTIAVRKANGDKIADISVRAYIK